MTLGLILKRMRREWRSLAILLLAVCLLTGFFALGPFYIRAVTDVGLRFELDNAPEQEKLITLVLDGEPITPETMDVVREQLGDLAVNYRYFIRADYTPPSTQGGLDTPGLATSGYVYAYGVAVQQARARTGRAYQPYAFDNMSEIFNLVEGRWPVRLPPPSVVSGSGLSDAEQQLRQVGTYDRGQVEVVITPTVAEKGELELGSRLVLGTLLADGTGSVASIVVVGIVEPKDPNDLIWSGNRMFLEGADVEFGLGQFRYDFGMATLPEAYVDWLADVVPGSSHFYSINTDTDVVTADNIQDINARVQVLQSRLSAYHPGASVLSGMSSILEGYSSDVDDTEGPIILLSGAILMMMLYHLINTVALVLEQQGAEWSSIVSRGGSTHQLIAMQLFTVGVLGLIGIVAGPLLSVGFMYLLERFGPLSTALGGRSLGITEIPTVSLLLSAGAGVAAVLVLTVPALPAAQRSLLRLKQMVSRPPTKPAWTRYSLDGVLVVVGLAFLMRLYYLVGGDFGDLLNNIIAAPRDVIQLIADNLTETGGLNDPFNLLGPALLLTGLALLWLRFFPVLMGGISRFFQRSRHLTTPLAVWNVARDPGHYAQLVLLLIGTLALGTASLGLRETRDRGAWETARQETGGSVRVETNTAQLDAETVDWAQMPGVSRAATFLHTVGDTGTSALQDIQIIGVDPDEVAEAYPELRDLVEPLRNLEIPSAPGLLLPDDADKLTAQVYALPPSFEDDPVVAVHLVAYLQDTYGVPFRVSMQVPEISNLEDVEIVDGDEVSRPTPTERWMRFEGDMPEQGTPPFRLMRIGINSRQGNIDAFEHTIYMDLLATLDVFGTATTLESFEDGQFAWSEAQVSNPYAASWEQTNTNVNRVRGVTLTQTTDEAPVIDGAAALRLDYQMGKIGGRQREPSIVVNPPDVGRVPVIINARFAEEQTGRGTYRTAEDEPLAVGDAKSVVLNLGTGSVEIGYEVIGVMEGMPTLGEKDPMMLTHIDLIQPVINQAAVSSYFFGKNEVWLELPDREPDNKLVAKIDELEGVGSVVYAWDRYGEIQREPLPSAVEGMLYAGYWISLALSLLDFAFYLIVTARQRLFTFGVLRSLGWNAGHIWRLLLIEQITLVVPALLIGSLIGAGLAYLLLPFLALVGGETLRVPWMSLGLLLMSLIVSFTVLMAVAAIFLRRMSVNQVLRLGEE